MSFARTKVIAVCGFFLGTVVGAASYSVIREYRDWRQTQEEERSGIEDLIRTEQQLKESREQLRKVEEDLAAIMGRKP